MKVYKCRNARVYSDKYIRKVLQITTYSSGKFSTIKHGLGKLRVRIKEKTQSLIQEEM